MRKNPIAPGEFYHIYNRGVDKRITFCDEADHRRFQLLLFLCNDERPVRLIDKSKVPFYTIFQDTERKTLVDICAYCLMPNHFHLLIYEKNEGGLSKFMQKLQTGYTMYFNKRYERTGALFQGTYKSSLIDTDQYLSQVLKYIHLNPFKLSDDGAAGKETETLNNLKDYPYSSYFDYIDLDRSEKTIINRSAFPFSTRLNLGFNEV